MSTESDELRQRIESLQQELAIVELSEAVANWKDKYDQAVAAAKTTEADLRFQRQLLADASAHIQAIHEAVVSASLQAPTIPPKVVLDHTCHWLGISSAG